MLQTGVVLCLMTATIGSVTAGSGLASAANVSSGFEPTSSTGGVGSAGFGPVYPVTAAWFAPRYSMAEWDKTLTQFAKQGGHTVITKAPAMTLVSESDMESDPDLQWCRSSDGVTCYDEILEQSKYGIDSAAFATYKHEEDYDARALITCPPYDTRIAGSRVYYRLVVPLVPVDPKLRCNLTDFHVLVLLTTFSGVDPHNLLVQAASANNMSVILGLPQPAVNYIRKQIYVKSAYYELVRRILIDHKTRYNETMYSTIKGYYFSFEFPLIEAKLANSSILDMVSKVGQAVHDVGKQLVVSTYVKGSRLDESATLQEHVAAFENLAATNSVDVISVKDGRGSGNGAYFWPTETNIPVNKSDAGLFQILKAKHPNISDNATYNDLFWTSVQQMFFHLAKSRDQLASRGTNVDLWLNIEAFDDLHDQPCLPIDTSGSGVDQMLNRVTKSRLDQALTHAGAYVQQVSARAWDPGFECVTADHRWSLRQQVVADSGRPIIANCSFHSSFNRSVVVIGYNLDGLTQGFTVDWPNVDGHRVVSTDVHGYYFELDWGLQHGRVPSLMYTQLYDPYEITQLAPRGHVTVKVDGGYHGCSFTYDFTATSSTTYRRDVNEPMKKFYKYRKTPTYRVYGQDIPF